MMNLKHLKRFTAMAMIATLAATSIPRIAAPVKPVNAMELEEENPLTSIWNTINNGDSGIAGFDDSNALVLGGSGSKDIFGKGGGVDGILTSYVPVKGEVTVVAKMDMSYLTAKQGAYAGIVARAAADGDGENKTQSVALYADMVNGDGNQIRYGRNLYNPDTGSTDNGASQVNSAVQVGTSTAAWLKMIIKPNGDGTSTVTSYVSADPEFSDNVKKSETRGIVASVVGFFATDGAEVIFSDISIKETYEEDGVTVNKIVYASKYGELKPEWSKSATYDETFTFEQQVNGNELQVVSTRGSDKGDIRSGKSVDYLLFPALEEDCTVSADVVVNSLNNATDKQGVAIGVKEPGEKTSAWLQFNKNNASQLNYNNGSDVNGGEPKASGLVYDGATSYNISCQRTVVEQPVDGSDPIMASGLYLVHKDASGSVINGGNDKFVTLSNISENLYTKPVQYGMAFSAVDVTVTNLTLINSEGYVIYDQNDYYKVKGEAATIDAITSAEVSADRYTIDLEWSIAEPGAGNVSYVVQVSKDNGASYETVATVKPTKFSYAPDGDGTYRFRVYSKSGESVGNEVESSDVVYKAPLASPVVKWEKTEDGYSLSWEAVEGATGYEVYGYVIEQYVAFLTSKNRPAYNDITAGNLEATVSDTSWTISADELDAPTWFTVVAVSEDNTSNPSEAVQVWSLDDDCVLSYGEDAPQITVVRKSDAAVPAGGTFSVTLTSSVDGWYTHSLRPDEELTDGIAIKAGEEFTIEASGEDLKKGRFVVVVKGENGIGTTKSFYFFAQDNAPAVTKVVGAAEGYTFEGATVYATLTEALADAAEHDVIFVASGDYNERLEITVPNLTIIGQDPEKVRIYASRALADHTATSMWDRNAVYVAPTAKGLTLGNLTIENTYPYTNGSDQQADALAIAADEVYVGNCRLIGYQDTLLVDSRTKDADTGMYEVTHQNFQGCYITGNVDFIYGSGSAIFYDCDIVGRYTEYKADGCYTAGRTYENAQYGLVFNFCRFLAEAGIEEGQYRLARPWGADDSTIFVDCYLCNAVRAEGYGDMSGNSYANARFYEVESYGPGAAVNNDRPLINYFFGMEGVLEEANYVIKALGAAEEEPDEVEYNIIEGAEQTLTEGAITDLLVASDADFDKFVEVQVDSAVVDPSNYDAVAGSTRVTLHADYLATLAVGVHELKIISDDGVATTTFEIKAAEGGQLVDDNNVTGNDNTVTTPSTGDTAPVAMYFMFMMAACVAGAVASKKSKRA